MANSNIPLDNKANLTRMKSICDRMERQLENLDNVLARKQSALSLAESDPESPGLLKYKLNRDCEDLERDIKVLEGKINWNKNHQKGLTETEPEPTEPEP